MRKAALEIKATDILMMSLERNSRDFQNTRKLILENIIQLGFYHSIWTTQ